MGSKTDAVARVEGYYYMSATGKPSLFEAVLNEAKPQCCSHGDCCKAASPSVPVHQLWQKAAEGDEFAQGFLSIMQPYPTHQAARTVVGALVDRTLAAAQKSEAFTSPDDVVFYHCRYLGADNTCQIYEDRPQFCRDYPDTPFVVMAEGCAFEAWSHACRSKYKAMQNDVATLTQLREGVAVLKAGQPLAPELEATLNQAHQQRELERWLQTSALGLQPLLHPYF